MCVWHSRNSSMRLYWSHVACNCGVVLGLLKIGACDISYRVLTGLDFMQGLLHRGFSFLCCLMQDSKGFSW